VLVDPVLAGQGVLYFAGGETSSMLKIRGADLVGVTGATVTRVSK
jgi:prolyl-tRNA editing enzyme YbaK/EbsC (Cys-tRNA(Pro) deacylase)